MPHRKPHTSETYLLDVRDLRARRVGMGLLVREVAERAHLSRSTVFLALREGRCGLGAARRICEVLGVDPADVLLNARTGQRLADNGKVR